MLALDLKQTFSGLKLLHTLVDCPAIAGFSIFALNGIVVDRDRESELSGWLARAQQGLKNINGNGVVILLDLNLGNFSEQ